MRRFIILLSLFFIVSSSAYGDEADVLLPLNRSELLSGYSSVASVSSDDVSIARAVLHPQGRVSLTARKIGSTHITLMSRKGKVIKRMLVKVTEDLPGARRSLRLLFPNELGLQLDYASDNVILSGYVSSLEVADRVEKVIKGFMKSKNSKLMNLMKVSATQQVTLMVRVGEIRKNELVKIGFSGGLSRPSGDTGILGGTNGFVQQAGVLGAAAGPPFGIFNWFTSLAGGSRLNITLDLLEKEGAFKVLANPVLTALSGEEASFMAGGEVPIAIFKSEAIGGIDYKPFGVMLNFNPLVVDSKTIRLKVAQEVSEIDAENTLVEYGYRLPSISTRKANTTVDLAPGESLMIAGLIKKDMNNVIRDVPGLARIPILGALFRSVEFMNGETELVISVTPYLTDPMKHSEISLPNFESPGVLAGMFLGQLQVPSGDLILEGSVGYIVD